jgi:carbon-monoxide dehydrogenase catalytic subunit
MAGQPPLDRTGPGHGRGGGGHRWTTSASSQPGQRGRCYHSVIVTPSPKAHFTGATHVEFSRANDPGQGPGGGGAGHRNLTGSAIPGGWRSRTSPWSSCPGSPTRTPSWGPGRHARRPLIEAIKAGRCGARWASVGCNNPKVKARLPDLQPGPGGASSATCWSLSRLRHGVHGQAGPAQCPRPADQAGPGLSAVCKTLGIPPVLHVGSCVTNFAASSSPCARPCQGPGRGHQRPAGGRAAPEWYSEKAATIGTYAVATGLHRARREPASTLGCKAVTELAVHGLEGAVGAAFAVEGDPAGADLIDNRFKPSARPWGWPRRASPRRTATAAAKDGPMTNPFRSHRKGFVLVAVPRDTPGTAAA